MKSCILVFDSKSKNLPADALILHWDSWEVPNTHFSLEAFLQQHFLKIRAEHATWAFDLGHLEVAGQSVAKHLKAKDSPSTWWCSLLYERHPKMTPNLYLIYKLRALEIFLEENECEKLSIVNVDPKKDQAILASLEDLCLKSKRSFKIESFSPKSTSSESLIKTIYYKLPPFLRVILRLIHWYFTIKRKLPKTELQNLDKISTATIVTYFPNIDLNAAKQERFLSRYWEKLHEALNARAIKEGSPFVRWLFIRFPAPQLSLDEGIKLKEAFNKHQLDGLSFNYLEEFLDCKDLGLAFKRFRTIGTQSLKIEAELKNHFHFKGSKLNFWPLAQKDYEESFRGYRGLERTLQNLAFSKYVKLVGKQRWFLYPLENCPWERMLCYQVRAKHAGLLLGAQHSTIRPTDLRYFDDQRAFNYEDLSFPKPDLFLANGRSAFEQWQKAGMPKEHLREVEALRYLYLAKFSRLEARAPSTLLVLTSFFQDETKAHLDLFIKALEAGLLANFKIILKPHPYLPLDPYLPKNHGLTIAKGPLSDYLNPAVLVWASNSTTAALEAAIFGLPLAVMQPTKDFDLSPIQDLKGLLRTATLEDVKTMLSLKEGIEVPKDYLKVDPSLKTFKALLNLD